MSIFGESIQLSLTSKEPMASRSIGVMATLLIFIHSKFLSELLQRNEVSRDHFNCDARNGLCIVWETALKFRFCFIVYTSLNFSLIEYVCCPCATFPVKLDEMLPVIGGLVEDTRGAS